MKRRRLLPSVELLESRAVPAIIPVTSLGDTGPGTLRAALEQAKMLIGIPPDLRNEPDTIQFQVTGTISLQSSLDIDINTGDITIDGRGANLTIERAASLPATTEFPLFSITRAKVDLLGLTLANGRTSQGGATHGGMYVNDGASLQMTGCVVRNFNSDYWGVIQVEQASAVIRNTLFTGITHGTDIQQRGVIHNWGGNVQIDSSLFNINNVGAGGVVLTESNGSVPASTVVRNSTVSGTSNSGSPAFVVLVAGGAAPANLTLDHNTIAENAGQALFVSGGGTATLSNNIFANNPGGITTLGQVISKGGNVADSALSGLNPTLDRLNVKPLLLGSLANYGGPLAGFPCPVRGGPP